MGRQTWADPAAAASALAARAVSSRSLAALTSQPSAVRSYGGAVGKTAQRIGAVLSWSSWCAEPGYDRPAVPAWAKRLPLPDSGTLVRSKMEFDRLKASPRAGAWLLRGSTGRWVSMTVSWTPCSYLAGSVQYRGALTR
ncbi:hypothetical protein [Streptomyces sp. NPDC048340]|uniref:hypothetical protein n=1 Tax=Streptomyces sp. NPDC048340 TaxID=3365537 RepID=UPI00371EEC1F